LVYIFNFLSPQIVDIDTPDDGSKTQWERL